MHKVVISGTGVFTPEQSISNAELVEAFNTYATRQNEIHADEIAAGTREPMTMSNGGFHCTRFRHRAAPCAEQVWHSRSGYHASRSPRTQR